MGHKNNFCIIINDMKKPKIYEAQIKEAIVRLLNHPGIRVFNNPSGAYKTTQGQFIRYGLGNGSSDLIGWKEVTITQEVVGKKFARFLAVEVKSPIGKPTDLQQKFLRDVVNAGGLAILGKDAREVLLDVLSDHTPTNSANDNEDH